MISRLGSPATCRTPALDSSKPTPRGSKTATERMCGCDNKTLASRCRSSSLSLAASTATSTIMWCFGSLGTNTCLEPSNSGCLRMKPSATSNIKATFQTPNPCIFGFIFNFKQVSCFDMFWHVLTCFNPEWHPSKTNRFKPSINCFLVLRLNSLGGSAKTSSPRPRHWSQEGWKGPASSSRTYPIGCFIILLQIYRNHSKYPKFNFQMFVGFYFSIISYLGIARYTRSNSYICIYIYYIFIYIIFIFIYNNALAHC